MQDFVISKKGKADAIERTIYTVPTGRICVLVDWFINNTTANEIANCSVVIGEQSVFPGTTMPIDTKYFESNRHIELVEGDSIVVRGKDLTYFFSGIEQDAYPDSTPVSYPSINQADLEAFRNQYSVLEAKILELFNDSGSLDSFTPNTSMKNLGSETKPWKKIYSNELRTNTIVVNGKNVSDELKKLEDVNTSLNTTKSNVANNTNRLDSLTGTVNSLDTSLANARATLNKSFFLGYDNTHLINKNDDLNNFVVPGSYVCDSYSICATLANLPSGINSMFRLVVINDSKYTDTNWGTQLLIVGASYSSSSIWIRAFGNSTTEGTKFDIWRKLADNDNLSSPSLKFIEFSTGYTSADVTEITYTNGVYTAPADGYILCKAKCTTIPSGSIAYFGVGRNGFCWNGSMNSISGNHIFAFTPVSKGDRVSYLGARIASMVVERFYYAKSAQ